MTQKAQDTHATWMGPCPAKALTLALVALMIGLLATGCRNTAKGIGKDVENAGEKIQDKVN